MPRALLLWIYIRGTKVVSRKRFERIIRELNEEHKNSGYSSEDGQDLLIIDEDMDEGYLSVSHTNSNTITIKVSYKGICHRYPYYDAENMKKYLEEEIRDALCPDSGGS